MTDTVTAATTNAPAEFPSVYELLGRAMKMIDAVGKLEKNTSQGYNFRGVDAVVNAVAPAFQKLGIIPVPCRVESAYRDVRTNNNKASRECILTVTYRFYGPRGDYVEVQVPGESMDFQDKGAPKAMSVAYRTALLQVLCIPTTDRDPDLGGVDRGHNDTRPADPYGGPPAEEYADPATTKANVVQNIKTIAEEVRQLTPDLTEEQMDSQLRDFLVVRMGNPQAYDEKAKMIDWSKPNPKQLAMLLNSLRERRNRLKGSEAL